jgi:EthD domain
MAFQSSGSMPSMQAAIASEQIREPREDENRFIDGLKLITVVVPTAQGVPLIKCMSTLKRRADVSPQKFKAERFDVHSFLVKRLPEVKGHTQNLVFDRSHTRGKPATYEDLPIDGIVELWFTDADSQRRFCVGCGQDPDDACDRIRSENPDVSLVETHEVV